MMLSKWSWKTNIHIVSKRVCVCVYVLIRLVEFDHLSLSGSEKENQTILDHISYETAIFPVHKRTLDTCKTIYGKYHIQIGRVVSATYSSVHTETHIETSPILFFSDGSKRFRLFSQ